jgi:hypothetical protein
MTQTMREKLISAAWNAIGEHGADAPEIVDAILAELREPDDGLTAALVTAVRQQVAWVSPDPTSRNPASEVLFVDAGSIDVDEIKVAMIDHIRSQR